MTDRVRIDKDIAGELFYFAIADGEEAKSVESMSHLWNSLGAAGFTRSDLIVGIGGGAVTDAAGLLQRHGCVGLIGWQFQPL